MSLREREHLRVAGSAFLVDGQVFCLGAHKGPDGTSAFRGPCILPSLPALYLCQSAVKVCNLFCPCSG